MRRHPLNDLMGLHRIKRADGLADHALQAIADITLFICSYRVQDRVIFKK